MTNLKGFYSSTKLKDAIHCFIATQIINSKENKELKDAFLAMDVNNDGKLDKQEMLVLYKSKFGDEQQAIEVVESMMSKVDVDNSGFIDYTEFIAASIGEKKLMSKKNLQVVFAMFDKDGSGTISASELNEMLGDEDLKNCS